MFYHSNRKQSRTITLTRIYILLFTRYCLEYFINSHTFDLHKTPAQMLFNSLIFSCIIDEDVKAEKLDVFPKITCECTAKQDPVLPLSPCGGLPPNTALPSSYVVFLSPMSSLTLCHLHPHFVLPKSYLSSDLRLYIAL